MAGNDVLVWIKRKRETMIQDIVSLVNIESVSIKSCNKEEPFGKGCKTVLLAAMGICRKMGFSAENHDNYCASFLWEGSEKKELGIFGHLDVVPAGSGWTYKPFSAEVFTDIIIGRGASDNKGAVVSILYALKYLKESGYKPKNSIRMFLGCNEECGMEDIEYYISNHKMPAFSFTPDVNFPVCYGEKGVLNITAFFNVGESVLLDFSAGVAKNAVPGEAYAVLRMDIGDVINKLPEEMLETYGKYVKISVKGIAAHSAFPEGSQSAEIKLAYILLSSGILDKPACDLMKAILCIFSDYYGKGLGVEWEDRLSGKLTHVGSMVRMDNGTCVQHINIRYNIEADRSLLLQRINSVLESFGFTAETVDDSPPSYFPEDHEIVQKLTKIVNRNLGTELTPYVMGGGTYARKLKNAIGFGPGNPVNRRRFGKERGGAHQPDEYVEIYNLMQSVAIYSEAIPALDRILTEREISIE